MQRPFIHLILFFILIIPPALPATSNKVLEEADSLFSRKRYTQALPLYENLFDKYKLYSPKMLLKMAYIQEGLNNYTKALYYLNLYYEITHDKKVEGKIEKLAEKHKLNGFDYSDMKYFYNLYAEYKVQITFAFTIIISILGLWIFIASFKRKAEVKGAAAALLVFLIVFSVLHNLIGRYSTALVADTTYLMSGPSAGADVLEPLGQGNKVQILDEDDIWIKILYNDKKGYIRKNRILYLQ